MKVLVCGGRDYNDYQKVRETLDGFGVSAIIQGGARGADSLGGTYANQRGISCRVFKADWDRYGKSAGFRRNQQMLDEGKPDVVVAFPGGKGTADMVKRAKKAGIKVIEVDS